MKLKFIDSIRGIAVLMVILVHTAQQVNGLNMITRLVANYGQMGVQLFFIASAYTLCLSTIKRDGEVLPKVKFIIRRYFRIAPVYYFGIVLYFLLPLGVSLLHTNIYPITNIDKYNFLNVFCNVLFVHGFYQPANNTIVPGGWSIGAEMAFYVLFPFLFKVARIKMNSIKGIILFILSGIIFSQVCLAIFAYAGYHISNNSFLYFSIINQLPVFLVGMGYFFLKTNYKYELKGKYSLLLFAVLTVIPLSLWQSDNQYIFSIIPIISGLSFVFLLEIFQKNEFLNQPLLVRIGQVSFSMYLLHFLFIRLITKVCRPQIFIINETVTFIIFYTGSVYLTFICALLSEKYIEKPSIELGKRIINKVDVWAKTKGYTPQGF